MPSAEDASDNTTMGSRFIMLGRSTTSLGKNSGSVIMVLRKSLKPMQNGTLEYTQAAPPAPYLAKTGSVLV